jgi:hypothetical protein
VRSSKWCAVALLAILTACEGDNGGGGGGNGGGGVGPSPQSGANQVAVAPVFQETAVWCWAAVAEMVFRYYGQPNLNPAGDYQCGIVGATAALGMLPLPCASNCALCVTTFGSPPQYVSLLQQYPAVARQATGFPTRGINVAFVPGPIEFSQVRTLIDDGQLIVSGITPSGIPSAFGPAHVALIAGYRFSPTSQRLIVNDPSRTGSAHSDPTATRICCVVRRMSPGLSMRSTTCSSLRG